ncbi:lung seven transmembrane receptor-domain-containing protein [Peziza echinospora]|nr:lung seven transmembrane receptor-domain-containing protein [Peziza echinospora]
MRRSILAGLLLAFGAVLTSAAEYPIDQDEDNRQQCAGMWSKKVWGGDVDPFISITFQPKPEPETISLLIFEWSDGIFLGRPDPSAADEIRYICDDKSISLKLCNESQLNQFIVSPDYGNSTSGTIFTTAVNLNDTKPLMYKIPKTGYYCVQTFSEDVKYSGVVVFQNSYGELPGSQIAKLQFYGGLAVIYALVAAFWAFLYVQHRRDILPVQNYITAIIVFLIVEMVITWGYYEYTNIHGFTVGSKALMIIVAILNAGRNSFSFFLLLIVCMGYGVVKHTLGKAMNLARGLAIAHFVFGVIYSVASLTLSPDTAGPIVLLVILPLAATLTAFYISTLNSLNLTMKELIERKQNVKSLMYKRLWWVLLGSIIVIFAFFFLNSLTFAGHGTPDFAPTHWKTRWFVLDGWLNLVYLIDLCIIAYIWRPTANNRRFAMSDELAQDDDGFEIASIGGSDDEDGRDSMDRSGTAGYGNGGLGASSGGGAHVVMKPPHQPLQSSGGGGGGNNGGAGSSAAAGGRGGVSQRDRDRDVEAGEAIFSVGEGEDGSDDDDEDGWGEASDKRRLTGRGKHD